MKKLFFLLTLFSIISCSNDNETTNSKSETTNEMLQRNSNNSISFEEAKIIAKTYTDTLSSLLDKIEDKNFKDENEAMVFSMNYLDNSLQDVNNSVLLELGYNAEFNYNDFSFDESINPDDINKIDLSEREKYYLTKLYDAQLTKDDASLLALTDSYINEVKTNKDIESLSISFALIDVNRHLFLSNVALKADTKCLKAAIRDGAWDGAVGAVSGGIRGGLKGIVVGGGNPITGGAGAIIGAVGGGLVGFVTGAVTGDRKSVV